MSKLRLRFLTGPRRGQQAAFGGPRVRIGRSRDNDVVLGDRDTPQSSGHHAEAVVESGRWWIRDLESTNGTFVNGVRVPRARLRSGDTISFGEDHFAVETRRPFLVAAGTAAVQPTTVDPGPAGQTPHRWNRGPPGPRYLAVGLDIAPGTSGSPIFRADGVVVGLVAGGEVVAGSGGGSTASGVNWGISVAALHELLLHRS